MKQNCNINNLTLQLSTCLCKTFMFKKSEKRKEVILYLFSDVSVIGPWSWFFVYCSLINWKSNDGTFMIYA